MIKQSIDSDLKTAMLAGDKPLVNTLRTIKSVILDAEVNQNVRGSGLPEEEVIKLLQKESKKRSEAATLYEKAGETERATKEQYEQDVLAKYLPVMLSEDELRPIIDATLAEADEVSMQHMGSFIGAIKAKVGARADGGLIARLVKEEIAKR